MRLDGFVPIAIALGRRADFEQFCAKAFESFVGGDIVFIAGDVQILHSMRFCQWEKHLTGGGSIVMPTMCQVDFIADVAVVVRMKVVTDPQIDFSNGLVRAA